MESFLHALERAITDAFESLGYVIGRIPTVLVAVLVVLVFARAAQVIVGLADRAGRISPRLDPSLRILIRQLISVGIIVFGVAIGFSLFGLSLTTIAATFGVAGLIVGFALKDMLENFIAGVLILWRRPFEIGDHIKVSDESGVVRDINFRTTALQTLDGVEVLIPNAQVFNKAVYNFSHYGARRTTIVFAVPTTADLADAQQRILEIAAATRDVMSEPPPEALLLGGDGKSHQLHLRYWTRSDPEILGRAESSIRAAAASFLVGESAASDQSAATGNEPAATGTTAPATSSSQ